jgi:thioredoxin-like negative regulator of GroEL
VDVDKNAAATKAGGINAMPTFQVWKKGKKVEEIVGASEDKLRALVKKHN